VASNPSIHPSARFDRKRATCVLAQEIGCGPSAPVCSAHLCAVQKRDEAERPACCGTAQDGTAWDGMGRHGTSARDLCWRDRRFCTAELREVVRMLALVDARMRRHVPGRRLNRRRLRCTDGTTLPPTGSRGGGGFGRPLGDEGIGAGSLHVCARSELARRSRRCCPWLATRAHRGMARWRWRRCGWIASGDRARQIGTTVPA
jgi:hypothetical protein